MLDHLLADFPKKGLLWAVTSSSVHSVCVCVCVCVCACAGPVRHFMELVVTGLSKNPHYSAKRKREMVKWYKKYFSQFSSEQLQVFQTRQP